MVYLLHLSKQGNSYRPSVKGETNSFANQSCTSKWVEGERVDLGGSLRESTQAAKELVSLDPAVLISE